MPEAESELVTGYHTEYSAMKFSMFFIAEYSHMLTASALMATLFLGGWDIPFATWDDAFWHEGALIRGFGPDGVPLAASPAWWKTLFTLGVFALKTGFFLLFFIWVRWTLPRFRYDQVMQLGWKVMLPTSLAYVMVMAASMLILDQVGVAYGFVYGLALTGVSLVCTGLFIFYLDDDRIIKGAGARLPTPGPALTGGGERNAVGSEPALMATLFLGGWDIPFATWDDAFWHEGALIRGFGPDGVPLAASPAWWKTLFTLGVFALKTGFFLLFFIWVRWTLPRFRYDQVMQLGWKVMLPTSLAYVMVMAASMLILDQVGVAYGFVYGLALTGVSLVCTGLFIFYLDDDRIIKGAGARLPTPGPALTGGGD